MGIDIVRIFCGGIIFYFGLEIRNPEAMAGYTEWLTFLILGSGRLSLDHWISTSITKTSGNARR